MGLIGFDKRWFNWSRRGGRWIQVCSASAVESFGCYRIFCQSSPQSVCSDFVCLPFFLTSDLISKLTVKKSLHSFSPLPVSVHSDVIVCLIFQNSPPPPEHHRSLCPKSQRCRKRHENECTVASWSAKPLEPQSVPLSWCNFTCCSNLCLHRFSDIQTQTHNSWILH